MLFHASASSNSALHKEPLSPQNFVIALRRKKSCGTKTKRRTMAPVLLMLCIFVLLFFVSQNMQELCWLGRDEQGSSSDCPARGHFWYCVCCILYAKRRGHRKYRVYTGYVKQSPTLFVCGRKRSWWRAHLQTLLGKISLRRPQKQTRSSRSRSLVCKTAVFVSTAFFFPLNMERRDARAERWLVTFRTKTIRRMGVHSHAHTPGSALSGEWR